jgi:hypothetical protein
MRSFLVFIAFAMLLPLPLHAENAGGPMQLSTLLESSAPPPDGFVRQKLDVTDGLIFMPKGWFYRNHGTASGWMWTLSKEDSDAGPYRTGMRIQIFLGLSQNNAPSGEALAASIFQQLGTEAKSVIVSCKPEPFGAFTRQCLETLETSNAEPGVTFHIRYSAFWTPSMLVITTFGAPAEDWDALKSTAVTMMAFRLIGPNFEKAAPAP